MIYTLLGYGLSPPLPSQLLLAGLTIILTACGQMELYNDSTNISKPL